MVRAVVLSIVAAMFAQACAAVAPRAVPEAGSAVTAQFVGRYRADGGGPAFEIAPLDDGGLVLKWPGRPWERLDLSADGLLAPESGLTLRIAQTSPGKVQMLTYGRAGGPVTRAVRVGPNSAAGR